MCAQLWKQKSSKLPAKPRPGVEASAGPQGSMTLEASSGSLIVPRAFISSLSSGCRLLGSVLRQRGHFYFSCSNRFQLLDSNCALLQNSGLSPNVQHVLTESELTPYYCKARLAKPFKVISTRGIDMVVCHCGACERPILERREESVLAMMNEQLVSLKTEVCNGFWESSHSYLELSSSHTSFGK
ncbi:hypothetical protein CEXT_65211 [Caerostris extrusa]|uniref:Uncharacterized protein n=1 Tax=Caerostris extrusa TaxID=172846 RepID=A0AAV4VER2_CAEEX|nr:hypothetical protein CEXT_65211 [Caerostris extrusa]